SIITEICTLPMGYLATTNVTYRTDLDNNEFIDIRIQKDQLVNFSYYARYINLLVGFNKRKFQVMAICGRRRNLQSYPNCNMTAFSFKRNISLIAIGKK